MDDEEFVQVLRKLESRKALLIMGADPSMSSKRRFIVKGCYETSE
jgi:hypothetical protein